jgi:hypothetical protein
VAVNSTRLAGTQRAGRRVSRGTDGGQRNWRQTGEKWRGNHRRLRDISLSFFCLDILVFIFLLYFSVREGRFSYFSRRVNREVVGFYRSPRFGFYLLATVLAALLPSSFSALF